MWSQLLPDHTIPKPPCTHYRYAPKSQFSESHCSRVALHPDNTNLRRLCTQATLCRQELCSACRVRESLDFLPGLELGAFSRFIPLLSADSQPWTSDETVVAGGTVVLKCQVREHEDSSLQWSNPAQQTLYFGEKRGKCPTGGRAPEGSVSPYQGC